MTSILPVAGRWGRELSQTRAPIDQRVRASIPGLTYGRNKEGRRLHFWPAEGSHWCLHSLSWDHRILPWQEHSPPEIEGGRKNGQGVRKWGSFEYLESGVVWRSEEREQNRPTPREETKWEGFGSRSYPTAERILWSEITYARMMEDRRWGLGPSRGCSWIEKTGNAGWNISEDRRRIQSLLGQILRFVIQCIHLDEWNIGCGRW